MSQRIPTTVVNHAAVDIAARVGVVWKDLVEQIVDAKGFRKIGTVTPFGDDDPAGPLGGYHMRLKQEDGTPDERNGYITERDEAARRVSMYGDYLSVPGGMRVYATYQVHDTPDGARFTLDCHTSAEIDTPVGASRDDVAAIIAEQKASHDEALRVSLERMKARLESR